jgi:hypothetical protein
MADEVAGENLVDEAKISLAQYLLSVTASDELVLF